MIYAVGILLWTLLDKIYVFPMQHPRNISLHKYAQNGRKEQNVWSKQQSLTYCSIEALQADGKIFTNISKCSW